MFRRTMIIASALVCGATGSGVAHAQQEHEAVRQGPESVFEEPVERIFDVLVDATATGPNARIGREFVYWGYTLADGRDVFLFACAPLEDVNCEARRDAICPAGNTLIARSELVGRVRQVQCRSIAVSAPGDLRPGCSDQEVENQLDAGIVQCH